MAKPKQTLLDTLLDDFAAFLVFILVILVLRSVGTRYLFGSSDPYTQELTRLFFPWLVFAGGALAVRKHANLAVTLVFDHLPSQVKWSVKFMMSLVVLIFLAALVIIGFRFSLSTFDQITSSLAIRKTWFYLSVPIGGLLMLLAAVDDLMILIKKVPRMPQ